MTSFAHVESDNNDIFRKAGANFNMILIWFMYDDFTQYGWENCQKYMAELRDTLYKVCVFQADQKTKMVKQKKKLIFLMCFLFLKVSQKLYRACVHCFKIIMLTINKY